MAKANKSKKTKTKVISFISSYEYICNDYLGRVFACDHILNIAFISYFTILRLSFKIFLNEWGSLYFFSTKVLFVLVLSHAQA